MSSERVSFYLSCALRSQQELAADLDQQLKAAEAELGRAAGDVEEAEKAIVRVKAQLSKSSITYRKATPLFRRQINQAFFAKVFVGLEGVTGSQPTDELAMILREDLAAASRTVGALSSSFWPGFDREPSSGARRIRTADLLGAIQALCQLSYSPSCGVGRIVPNASQEQG